MNSLTKTPFELLPERVTGNILDQLNQVTENDGIVNKAGIPVIMRYVGHLICTSKTMASNVSHPMVTDLFLKSLSKKYRESCEHFAALWNTISARKWLWEYIKKNGDDKVYQAIQGVYELASQVLQEAKEVGLKFKLSEGRKDWPTPNPFYYQTKQGFVLYNDSAPSFLATPFGEIKIYGGGSYTGCASYSVTEVFIKRLKGTFEGLTSTSEEKFFEIETISQDDKIREINKEELKKISKKELHSKKGTQNLIMHSRCGVYGVYKITEVQGTLVPDAIKCDSKETERSYELIKRIWEMLEANRIKLDPTAKKIEPKKIIKQPKDIQKPLFNNLSEVSKWGIELVTQLRRQPNFIGETWLDMPTKLLVIKDYSQARIIEILNAETKNFLDKDSKWPIYAFGCGNNCRSLNGKNLGSGIELWMYENHKFCTLDSLKKAYDLVVKKVSENWVRSELRDYPAILHTKSEEDYVLFVKKQEKIGEEDVFIRCLAEPLGLSTSIDCQSNWKERTSSGIYLWVKKDGLEKTLEALNIKA